MTSTRPNAIVVGSGPNGLCAAIVLAQHGWQVQVFEAEPEPGGGVRSAPLTLPGFIHDVCSAVYPLGVASPFLRTLPLARYGLEWIHPLAPLAHPFENGTVALLERSLSATASRLGRDAAAYAWLMRPLVSRWPELYAEALGPILHLPRHPVLLGRFGLRALPPTTLLARLAFRDEPARALFAGIAAHATLPLDESPSAAFGFMLGVAGHAVGWPIARGGAQSITTALIAHLRSLGGDVVTDRPVSSLSDLPPATAVLLDVTPRQVLALVGSQLPASYRGQLADYKYGLGTFKLDWALDRPIPWRAPECALAATVHLGGTLEEIAADRRRLWRGVVSDRPFLIVVQPSLFDPTRAPEGKHTAWAYCHVPNGSSVDMTDAIESQIERYAPGFRGRILARHVMGPAALERHNPNLIGGDINGGEATLEQLVFRPARRLHPYTTPLPNVFLCSSSTPPGGGVHGMAGYHAARAVLHARLPVAPPSALSFR